MAKNLSRGFTLIELLMVVALIGILATIVVGMLNSAKSKGEDSAIKEQLTSLRTQAELYAGDNSGNYTDMFTGNNTWASADPAIQAILDFLSDRTGTHTAGSSASDWAAQVKLKEDTSQFACISSTSDGLSLSTSAMAAGATVCP